MTSFSFSEMRLLLRSGPAITRAIASSSAAMPMTFLLALAADGVDFVHEDDAGRVLLRLVEEVADAARADADEHLHELRAGDREEGHAGFAGDRLAEQGLAGSGRPDQQHALGDARAEGD